MEDKVLEPTTNLIDLNIKTAPKQKIRINGNDDCIIELNLSDMSVVSRFSESIEKVNELQNYNEKLDKNDLDSLVSVYNDMETKMRDIIDYIFDYPVCHVICGTNSVFTIVDDKYLYEVILDSLFDLYNKQIDAQLSKVKKRLNKHISKYTK